MENLIPSRSEMLESMQDTIYDVIVIGGGVTGAGVARDAMLRGLKVALLEKGDFASGTSSMTTKLIHGGLRYLQNYEFRLVRQAALERKVHLEIAPHLAEVMEILLPVFDWNDDSPFMLRLGLILYDILSIPKRIGKHKNLSSKQLKELLPLLNNQNIRGGALFHDVRTNDARLTLANCLSAAAGGAHVVNYVEMLSFETTDNEVNVVAVDNLSKEEINLVGRYIVLCGGPWSQIIEERGIDYDGKAKVRLTRGTHLILKKKLDKYGCLLINEDDRVTFLLPSHGNDLAGTTDLDHDGSPDDVKPTLEEINYIINACNKIFPSVKYTLDDVQATFAGVRPLVYQKGVKEGKVSREHIILHDKPNRTLTIVGGKLTTYRVMSKQALDKVVKHMGVLKGKCMTDKLPIWGGEVDDWIEFYNINVEKLIDEYSISKSSAEMLVQWYGSEIDHFKEYLSKYGTNQLETDLPWLEAQIAYSCEVELAQTPIDVMRRRLNLMFERGNGLDSLERIVEIMSVHLNWDDIMRSKMIIDTKQYIDKFIRVTN
ncbi:MAG: glycerol-3-phosphate dehydrogenase/oxidase [Candidatus Kariarchaeaceae archaeon]|jgi:glycerol-3-phosphate dehydrogenase